MFLSVAILSDEYKTHGIECTVMICLTPLANEDTSVVPQHLHVSHERERQQEPYCNDCTTGRHSHPALILSHYYCPGTTCSAAIPVVSVRQYDSRKTSLCMHGLFAARGTRAAVYRRAT